ncbi:hypothetical protein [Actinacidiphila epipremni]|jgi:hypothetical protein|uniref:Transcriptional regulator n=1 Tax=Actinacidiphila epipremni TaxID=2053013 RepID=A0ABX0ZU11_9ACTN|nr:hypothetical protein [Actinacidiphila epipremni]NJP44993.1 hypothetical protein [Actinacidiphila epipremni]
MHAGARYADIRPYTVPESLSELAGPTYGFVDLPTSLDWSQQHRYDLSVDKDCRRLYETVIREAMAPSDLRRFLNKELLLQLWPSLWLPSHVKSLWQTRFPQLRSAAAA